MDKIKGLSSDCKLPPEIAIALQLSGEYPCDRCNEDRQICRGEPKGSSRKEIEYINITIRPEYMGMAGIPNAKILLVDIEINGKRYGLREIYAEDMLVSMFDRLWESVGRKLKQIINK